ncbi:hypothetical protein [Streptomyces sp. NPDC053048]|uniref:hypothetical protein n=1 Tax=Streptomyces sp. NPDC053048 TaxID=3365694 RepID=UPI0037CECB40
MTSTTRSPPSAACSAAPAPSTTKAAGATSTHQTNAPKHSTGCYATHCQAAATLEQIRALAAQLAETGASCLWQCGATEIADRITTALDNNGG